MAPDSAPNFHGGHFESLLKRCRRVDIEKVAGILYRGNTRLNQVLDFRTLRRGALLAQDRINLQRPQQNTQHRTANAHDDIDQNSIASDSHDGRTVRRNVSSQHGAENTNGHIGEPPFASDSSSDEPTKWEQDALDRESSGSLKSLKKDLIVILATCATGATVQGWSQQSIVGANLYWPAEYGLEIQNSDQKTNDLVYFGLVNAVPYFAASLCGVWIIDPISAYQGRRGALLFAAMCSLIAPIGASYTRNWYELLVCRIIQGIGMGAKASVVPVLESEVCPPRLRGRLLVLWQTFVAFGIFLGAAANCIFQGEWRHQIGIAFVPAVPLICLSYVIPESPRWLIKKEKYKKAFQVLVGLRETKLQAARDFFAIYAYIKNEKPLSRGEEVSPRDMIENMEQYSTKERTPLGFFTRFRELFTIPRNRRAVVSSCIVMCSQQFSGINIFAFLATTIFSSIAAKDSSNEQSKSDSTNLLVNLGFGAVNAIFSASAFGLIHRWGRRSLLLISLITMAPLLLLTGHYLDEFNLGSSIALVFVYAIAYSPGAGVIPFMYSSEVFGQRHREVGMSLAVAVNLALAGALAMAVPLYAAAPENSQNMRLLGAFAGLDLLAAILVWLSMRSPGQALALEDMNFVFIPHTFDYIIYQIGYVLPFTIESFLPGHQPNDKLNFVQWKLDRNKRSQES